MSGRKWVHPEDEYLRQHLDQGYDQLAEALGRTRSSVKHRVGSLGLLRPARPRPFTEEEDRWLMENFESLPIGQVARHLGRHVESIRQRARRMELVNETTSHRRAVNLSKRSDYFRDVDTPMKAYILGLIASDGYVSSTSNAIGIKLHADDRELVELIRDELSPESRVHEYLMPPLPGYSKVRRVAQFSISSAELKDDLMKLGITPRKTFTLQFPALQPELENSFLLGSYDGDGHLHRDRLGWDLYSASESFLKSAHEAIRRNTGLQLNLRASRRLLWCLYLRGPEVVTLDAWLHANVPGLPRKKLGIACSPRALTELQMVEGRNR